MLFKQHRSSHSAEFKVKVTLSALSESKTLAEIASEYRVHPTQITRWKKELIENVTDLFGKGKKKDSSLWNRFVDFILLALLDLF